MFLGGEMDRWLFQVYSIATKIFFTHLFIYMCDFCGLFPNLANTIKVAQFYVHG